MAEKSKKRPSAKSPPKNPSDKRSVYLHFPYCLYKCHYCDFNSYAYPRDQVPFERYTRALIAELKRRAEAYARDGTHAFEPGSAIGTVFFGGGTPSLMRPEDVARILEALGQSFRLEPDAEITLEANPKTITPDSLERLKRAGINRLSLGIQSLHDAYLAAFGRIHSADDARQALRWAANAGFKAWSADLIFGFPGQSPAEWKRDLDEMLGFGPSHLSCYSFTVEEGTSYFRKVRDGEAPPPSEEAQAEMFEWTASRLEGAGLKAYEISNFAAAGRESRHNVNYWNYGPFMGLGAGASSFFHGGSAGGEFGYRTLNVKEPKAYMNAVLEGAGPWFESEPIRRDVAMGEFMMMGLRLSSGVSRERFSALFDAPIENRYGPVLDLYRSRGWLEVDRHVRLTPAGRMFTNQVVRDLLA